MPTTLVGEWRRREEGREAAMGGVGQGSPARRVPCTTAGERGAQRIQSAAASRASTPAMGLSQSPRPPPLMILLLVLSLWLPLGAGKCHSETPGAVGQKAVRVLTGHRLLLLRDGAASCLLVAFLCPSSLGHYFLL